MPTARTAHAGCRLEIRGTVQGVGFRPWVYRLAHDAALTGRVRNDSAGVTIDAFGAPRALEIFVDAIVRGVRRPPAATIDSVTRTSIPVERVDDFRIVESIAAAERRVSIPPDLATCPDCLAELRDASDRRHRYAFTNCTNCGPRFTIAVAVPYDRPTTTMGAFAMCPQCAEEYHDPGNRRFHAQPNACPVCGPRLELRGASGDPIDAAALAIASGRIVALKGLGGFQLVCDATSDEAVRELRRRKRRDEKPFAVMVADIEAARALAQLDDEEVRLLASVERPIVLVQRRTDAAVSTAVAPRNPLVGILLPNSPLHHLLVTAAGRPIVMTSGNFSEEPIARQNDEAIERFGGIADVFVLHDRDIVTRCDDSVVRVIAKGPAILRRARGYVPRPIHVAARFERPVLACGALLKNTFCVAAGSDAVLGPHIGDLENVETYQAYVESIARFERFLQVTPEVVAHDLHPDYLSTRYALERKDVVAIGVQHHHAHIASVMAEQHLDGEVLGLAFDGTGLGTDGTSWGGELLLASYTRFTRLATFRPLPLPGGDAAVREPWRLALALLDDAFGGDAPLDAFPVLATRPPNEIATALQMIRGGVNTPLVHGVGRYFDAFGSVLLGLSRATYEGQVAFELNMAADPGERQTYRYDVLRSAMPLQVDLRQTARDAVFELLGGASVATVAARIHNTVAAISCHLVRSAARDTGRRAVALSGGCFQNARLAESIVAGLSSAFNVHLHRQVPPGDGGIALGQAVIANAIAGSV